MFITFLLFFIIFYESNYKLKLNENSKILELNNACLN